MLCETYIDMMLDSLEGELTLEQETELKEHLNTCESCRSLYETYRNIDAAVFSLEEPPASLKDSVMEAISRENQSKKQKNLKRYRFTAIAACAAIAILFAGANLPAFTGSTGDSASLGTEFFSDTAEEQAMIAAAGTPEEPMIMADMSRDIAAYDGGGASETVYVELSEAGYTGKLLAVSINMGELLTDYEEVEIPSGNIVYHVTEHEFSELESELEIYEELLLPGEDSGDIYIMIQ